jgi:uncharacterized protein with HEPN domain
MSKNRLPDYLDHMQQAASDACSFVDGMDKDAFLADKRTQQAVIMSVIIIGEAATKVMDGYAEFSQAHPEVAWRGMRGCVIGSRMATEGRFKDCRPSRHERIQRNTLLIASHIARHVPIPWPVVARKIRNGFAHGPCEVLWR